MQMRYRLAHGEGGLMEIQGSSENDAQHVVGAAWFFFAGRQHVLQALFVMVHQLCNARVQAAKHTTVGWHGQGVVGQIGKLLQRI